MAKQRLATLTNVLLPIVESPLDPDTSLIPTQNGLGDGSELYAATLRDIAEATTGGVLTWATYVDPAAADTDYFVAAGTATTAGSRTWTVGGALPLLQTALPGGYARRFTITSTSNAAFTAVTMTIVGTDVDGNPLTDEILTTAGGGATDSSSAAFATVTSVTLPAQGGAGATFQMGFSAGLGLPKPLKARVGVNVVLREHAGGSLVTNGVFVLPASAEPYGLYTPNSAPDGSRDYAVLYEVDG